MQVSPFLSEEAGGWHECAWHGLGAAQADQLSAVTQRFSRGKRLYKSLHPESSRQSLQTRDILQPCVWDVFYSLIGTLALSVSPGSFSTFQPRLAVWGRLCQPLAAAWEELLGYATSQAVPLALVATILPLQAMSDFLTSLLQQMPKALQGVTMHRNKIPNITSNKKLEEE